MQLKDNSRSLKSVLAFSILLFKFYVHINFSMLCLGSWEYNVLFYQTTLFNGGYWDVKKISTNKLKQFQKQLPLLHCCFFSLSLKTLTRNFLFLLILAPLLTKVFPPSPDVKTSVWPAGAFVFSL